MDDETREAIQILQERMDRQAARIDALAKIIYNYLEAGSSMALAGVKAQLKSV